MRRKLSALLSLALAFLLLAAVPALALTPEDYNAENPAQLSSDMLYSEAAILIDATSGDVLFAKNENIRMHPASTTKIMTLLLGIESGFDLDAKISIPQAAADIAKDSTIVPVFPGDTMTFGDLLIGFFLNSGNDGANAVAVLVAGSVEAFVERMNRRAEEIGCRNTHFVNAHGYTEDGHYTTAYDMALIARVAMQNETFRTIAGMGRATIHVDGREDFTVGQARIILQPGSPYYYEGIAGIKSGTTTAAGNCFVGAAMRNGAMLISVVLKAPQDTQRYTDTIRVMDFGWTCYDSYTIDQMYDIAKSQIGSYVISNAATNDPDDGRIELQIAQISNSNYLRMVEHNSEAALQGAVADFISHADVQLTHDLTAPISRGEIIGDFSYYDESTGDTVTAKLVANRDVAERLTIASLLDYFPFLRIFRNRLFLLLLIVLLLLLILIIILVLRQRAARQRRRRRIYEQRRAEYLRSEREEQQPCSSGTRSHAQSSRERDERRRR